MRNEVPVSPNMSLFVCWCRQLCERPWAVRDEWNDHLLLLRVPTLCDVGIRPDHPDLRSVVLIVSVHIAVHAERLGSLVRK